ncbi:hypothetical protein GP2143_01140 [marine gamma proteobacterium HTCC2143]|uniref:Uncharacterized protein n=1 Tax=marine gamma proteobacterium HTCC2143 TaxID=247633 RepID=A0YGG6_9GAMM|nr:hypothetical protein GP2143_01140 [marine gamma proteobacterium HTCC2143]
MGNLHLDWTTLALLGDDIGLIVRKNGWAMPLLQSKCRQSLRCFKIEQNISRRSNLSAWRFGSQIYLITTSVKVV